MDNVNQLLAGVAVFALVFSIGIDQMRPDVIFQDHCQQTVHGASTAGDLLQYIVATAFLFQRALDRVDLPAYAPNSVQKLLLVTDGMAHERPFI
jgi:hypothetical protein